MSKMNEFVSRKNSHGFTCFQLCQIDGKANFLVLLQHYTDDKEMSDM